MEDVDLGSRQSKRLTHTYKQCNKCIYTRRTIEFIPKKNMLNLKLMRPYWLSNYSTLLPQHGQMHNSDYMVTTLETIIKQRTQTINTIAGLRPIFALAGFFTWVLAPLEDCRKARIVCRAWSGLAVTLAHVVAVAWCSRHSITAAGIAAANAAVPALGYICALGTLARPRSFLVAPRRTFRDAVMEGAGWRPCLCWFPHPARQQSHANGSNDGSLKSRGTQSHYVIFVWTIHN